MNFRSVKISALMVIFSGGCINAPQPGQRESSSLGEYLVDMDLASAQWLSYQDSAAGLIDNCGVRNVVVISDGMSMIDVIQAQRVNITLLQNHYGPEYKELSVILKKWLDLQIEAANSLRKVLGRSSLVRNGIYGPESILNLQEIDVLDFQKKRVAKEILFRRDGE